MSEVKVIVTDRGGSSSSDTDGACNNGQSFDNNNNHITESAGGSAEGLAGAQAKTGASSRAKTGAKVKTVIEACASGHTKNYISTAIRVHGAGEGRTQGGARAEGDAGASAGSSGSESGSSSGSGSDSDTDGNNNNNNKHRGSDGGESVVRTRGGGGGGKDDCQSASDTGSWSDDCGDGNDGDKWNGGGGGKGHGGGNGGKAKHYKNNNQNSSCCGSTCCGCGGSSNNKNGKNGKCKNNNQNQTAWCCFVTWLIILLVGVFGLFLWMALSRPDAHYRSGARASKDCNDFNHMSSYENLNSVMREYWYDHVVFTRAVINDALRNVGPGAEKSDPSPAPNCSSQSQCPPPGSALNVDLNRLYENQNSLGRLIDSGCNTKGAITRELKTHIRIAVDLVLELRTYGFVSEANITRWRNNAHDIASILAHCFAPDDTTMHQLYESQINDALQRHLDMTLKEANLIYQGQWNNDAVNWNMILDQSYSMADMITEAMNQTFTKFNSCPANSPSDQGFRIRQKMQAAWLKQIAWFRFYMIARVEQGPRRKQRAALEQVILNADAIGRTINEVSPNVIIGQETARLLKEQTVYLAEVIKYVACVCSTPIPDYLMNNLNQNAIELGNLFYQREVEQQMGDPNHPRLAYTQDGLIDSFRKINTWTAQDIRARSDGEFNNDLNYFAQIEEKTIDLSHTLSQIAA